MRNRACCGIIPVLLVSFLAFPVTDASAQTAEIPLGSPMPGQSIQLIDESGKSVVLRDLAGSASTVILFWSNRCPWTSRYQDRISKLYNELSSSDNAFILVNSNDGGAFPDENAAASAGYFKANRIASHYLTDSKSALARAFGASRAPHAFVFDENRTLVYVGGIDDSPGDPSRVSKQYIRDVLRSISAGQRVESPQTKAFGCMIRFVQ